MNLKWSGIAIAIVLAAATAAAGAILPIPDAGEQNGQAPANAPVISETETGAWDLERVDFIHYAKPDSPPGQNNKGPKEASCYKLLGVKWLDTPVSYAINPTNTEGLSEAFVVGAITDSAGTWDDATSTNLFGAYALDSSAQYGVQNYQNAIAFGNYPQNNVIGVTTIWYTRRGKEIVEFDMLLNTRFDWGNAEADPSLMDVQNIVTHELGHGVGLDDIYQDTCTTVTMYGYSGEGDIEKRSLEEPDVTGLQKMYGG